jgi:hypothetical protein
VEAETGVGAEEDEGRKKTKFIYVLIEGRSWRTKGKWRNRGWFLSRSSSPFFFVFFFFSALLFVWRGIKPTCLDLRNAVINFPLCVMVLFDVHSHLAWTFCSLVGLFCLK